MSRVILFPVSPAVVGLLWAAVSYLFPSVCNAAFLEPVDFVHEWTGEVDGDGFGWINRTVGDVNDDGVVDLGIGVINNDEGGEDAGKVYIYSGADGSLIRTHLGTSPNDYFGHELAGVGDVSADGIDDYIISRPRSANYSQYFGPGEAVLYSGANGDSLYAWGSPTYGLGMGAQVAGAGDFTTGGVGDINNDGTPDILVSALLATNPGFGLVGKVYVFSGADYSEVLQVVVGEQSIDLFGFGMGGVGDLDDDGHSDYVVGAPNAGAGDRGRAYVFSGRTGEQFAFSPFDADTTGGFFGFLFAKGPGDVNADGTPDICVTDLQDTEAGAAAGKAYIYSGVDGSTLHEWSGVQAGDGFGVGRGCGDVNFDGFADLVLSSFSDDAQAENAGTAYVLSGRDGSILRSITNDAEGDLFGYSTVGVGDIDDDGAVDFMVSAVGYDGSGVDLGKVWVIKGNQFLDPASVGEGVDSAPSILDLSVRPNPVFDRAGVSFRIPTAGTTTIDIHDARGGLVRNVLSADLPAGAHRFEWDGRMERGQRAPSGVYFVRLRTNGFEESRRLVVRR